MPITAAEIAAMCNVSRTTVDRALRNKKDINEETKKRILEVAEKYHYRPNYLASSLSTGSTRSVGIIVFDLYNPHFSYMVNALEHYLSSHGIFSYVCISNKDTRLEAQIIDDLCNRRVDGIALVPINCSNAFIQHIKSKSLPIVTVSNRLEGFPFVGGEGNTAVYSGMNYLYTHGYRTVHFVCPPMRYKGEQNIYTQEDRLNGYLHFKAEHPDVDGAVFTSADFLPELEQRLSQSDKRPAIFCSSDHYTLAIRKRFLELGWDLNTCPFLMGFDGLDNLYHLTPRPASMYYPAEDIGTAAAKLLLDLINGVETSNEIILPCPLLHGTVPI